MSADSYYGLAAAGILLALAVLIVILWLRRRQTAALPLPTEWALTARPVFNMEERRVYRQLREALPHHIVLSKLPLVRFCQPADPQEVRYWYELLGATHVGFAICSANGRVLAAIDIDTERGNSRRSLQIKQKVLAACRVRYLRCPVDHLPSIPELQLLVPHQMAASRGPQPAAAATQDPLRGQGLPAPSPGPVDRLGPVPGLLLWRGRPPGPGLVERIRSVRARPVATRQVLGRISCRRAAAGAALTADSAPGYAGLTPQQVLDALDAVGLRGDGRILQLNSYENRVFQLFLEDGSAVVAKFYRPARWTDAQIIEEHRFATELAAAEVPVVPPLLLERSLDAPPALQLQPDDAPTLATLSGHRFAVASRCAGREPELDHPGTLQRLGRFIGRLHAVGQRSAFVHRHAMEPVRDSCAARDALLASGLIPDTQLDAWREACEQALAAVDTAMQRHGALRLLRLHGDCHIGNVLWRDDGERSGPHMVDLDDACMGPAVQDLWMLVSGDDSSMQSQLAALLSGYREFADFDARELALIEPLRTLRLIRHSAWLAARWHDPAFPAAFPFFGTAAWWSQHSAQLREQVQAMNRHGD